MDESNIEEELVDLDDDGDEEWISDDVPWAVFGLEDD